MVDGGDGTGLRVLVLDSGVGGLTVLAAIRRKLPGAGVIYLADNAGFPYGAWSPAALAERLVGLVTHLRERAHFDAVVVACNAASTTALAALRGIIDVPVVGVVPAIKPAGERSQSRVIGLLATPTTVDTPYVQGLIDRYAADCRVIRVGPPDLAHLAEAHCRGETVDTDRLIAILTPLVGVDAPPVDTIVLGCTHYPLLLDRLRPLAPAHVRWLEPGPAVARRLADVLAGQTSTGRFEPDFALFTGNSPVADRFHRLLADHGLSRIETVPDLAAGPTGDVVRQAATSGSK